jgi:hypothetical protein
VIEQGVQEMQFSGLGQKRIKTRGFWQGAQHAQGVHHVSDHLVELPVRLLRLRGLAASGIAKLDQCASGNWRELAS